MSSPACARLHLTITTSESSVIMLFRILGKWGTNMLVQVELKIQSIYQGSLFSLPFMLVGHAILNYFNIGAKTLLPYQGQVNRET